MQLIVDNPTKTVIELFLVRGKQKKPSLLDNSTTQTCVNKIFDHI